MDSFKASARQHIKLADSVTGGHKPGDRYGSYKEHREEVRDYMRTLNDAVGTRLNGHARKPLASRILEVVNEYPCFHQGLECDEWGWVVRHADGSMSIVETSHGSPYLAKASDLRKAQRRYVDAVAKAEAALALIGGGDESL